MSIPTTLFSQWESIARADVAHLHTETFLQEVYYRLRFVLSRQPMFQETLTLFPAPRGSWLDLSHDSLLPWHWLVQETWLKIVSICIRRWRMLPVRGGHSDLSWFKSFLQGCRRWLASLPLHMSKKACCQEINAVIYLVTMREASLRTKLACWGHRAKRVHCFQSSVVYMRRTHLFSGSLVLWENKHIV